VVGLALAYYLNWRKFGIRASRCLLITYDDIKYLVRALRF
jgi:hypothetical protein